MRWDIWRWVRFGVPHELRWYLRVVPFLVGPVVALLWACVLVFPGLLVDRSLRGQELTVELRVKAEKDLRTLLQGQELTAEQQEKAENDLRTLLQGQQLTAEQRVKAENDVRTTLLQGVAGLLLLVGAIATFRQLRVSREGQITERFTKAIDQLGAKSLEVRLGAIYALERIARDSERDHWPIMEVLTAYVRQHSAWMPQEDQFKPPAPDIRAILTVLGRRARRGEDQQLDLRETDLRGAELWNAHLERAHLSNAHLEFAHLSNAHLEGAVLWGAHLEGAELWGAHLEGADLSGAIGLTKPQIDSAFTDKNTTKLPDYLASTRPT